MSNSIAQETERSKKLNEALKQLRGVYEPDVKSLVYLCYQLGATQDEIGKALNISKQTVSQQYPKKKGVRRV